MTLIASIILELVVPVVGTIFSNLVYVAPYRDLQKAVQRGTLGDLNPTPWAFMYGNGFGWSVYAILVQDLWIFFASAPGALLSVWLNIGAVKLQYQMSTTSSSSFGLDYSTEHEEEDEIHDMEICQPTEQDDGAFEIVLLEKDAQSELKKGDPSPCVSHETLIMTNVFIWICAVGLVSFSSIDLSFSTRRMIVGILVNINQVFFYAAPLSTIATVVKSRNSASIHLWTMLANTANGAFWTTYSLTIDDPYIYVPCGIATAFSLIQILFYLLFPRIPTEIPQ